MTHTLTPNPTNHNIQIHIDGEYHGECISYLLAEKVALEIEARTISLCSTPGCQFSARYQCFKCQKSLCPAHALSVGRGFIYCGLCAPEPKSTTRNHSKKITQFTSIKIITNLNNSARAELGIKAWYETTEEKPAGSRRTIRRHQGFVQGPDATVAQDLGWFDYALMAEQAVNEAATRLVHEYALEAA